MSRRLNRPQSRIAAAVAVVALAGGLSAVGPAVAARAPAARARLASATPSITGSYRPPRIRHVWIIMLENRSAQYTYGPPGRRLAPYLAKTLRSKGAFLPDYYSTGHDSLDNYVAAVSGQASNYELGQDCGLYANFNQFGGENFDKFTKYGQLSGEGCVFPRYIKTVSQQLSQRGLTWKAYMQDMGNDPGRDGTVATRHGPACGHPAVQTRDKTDSTAPRNDSYATRHNPFMYFHWIIDQRAYCAAHVVSLRPLAGDLRRISTTPDYSWISPNTCDDGHDIPRCQDGQRGGLPRVNDFLKRWIPRIMNSTAYRQNGLIVIITDESGHDTNATACCGEEDGLGFDDPSHPNMNEPGLYGPGGGRVGAVLLSKYIRPGTVSTRDYNHYSLMRSVEDLFGLAHLGDAQQSQVHSFGPDVYTRR
jgi:phosphatidylinositol-3-phosphatase